MTRLEGVCSLIERCNCLADIGCDHGLVAKYAVELGCKTVVASDISEVSLAKAREVLGGFDSVIFALSDGFKNIPVKADTAVLSGMGGKKIMEILDTAEYKPTTLVLGPQHDTEELRLYLGERGYRIDADFMVEERGKYYSLIRACLGAKQILTPAQLLYGVFYKKENATLKEFCLMQRKKLTSYAQTPQNKQKLALVEEVLKWQK